MQRVQLNNVAQGGGLAKNQQFMEAIITIDANNSPDGDCIRIEFGEGRGSVWIEQNQGHPRVILHVDSSDPVAALNLIPGAAVEVDRDCHVKRVNL